MSESAGILKKSPGTRSGGTYVQPPSESEYDVCCRAQVARSGPESLTRRPPDAGRAGTDARDPERPAASDSWRIQVDYAPPADRPARRPRRAEHVRELPRLPPSHVPLGDVVTRCDAGCSESAVRHGLHAVAGRMGASGVVDVRCAARGQGFVCAATAVGYELAPERDPRASRR